MSNKRNQVNLRFRDPAEEEEFKAAIGVIQRSATGSGPVPPMSEVIKTAVYEKRDRVTKGKR